MNKKIYVTFQIKSISDMWTMRYAVECNDKEQAMSIALDLNSIVYVSYIRLNFSGRFKKGTILCTTENYLDYINND